MAFLTVGPILALAAMLAYSLRALARSRSRAEALDLAIGLERKRAEKVQRESAAKLATTGAALQERREADERQLAEYNRLKAALAGAERERDAVKLEAAEYLRQVGLLIETAGRLKTQLTAATPPAPEPGAAIVDVRIDEWDPDTTAKRPHGVYINAKPWKTQADGPPARFDTLWGALRALADYVEGCQALHDARKAATADQRFSD